MTFSDPLSSGYSMQQQKSKENLVCLLNENDNKKIHTVLV